MASASAGLALTPEQAQWVAAHAGQPLQVGFDPYSGMDSFALRGRRQGFLHLLLDDINAQTGLKLVAAQASGWDEAYRHFVQGQTDVLYGANPTPEREKIMRFTAPAQRYPYVVLARKDGSVKTLGDIDGKAIGFIASDFVLQALPQAYPKIRFAPAIFPDQAAALPALLAGRVDAFVTSGGGSEVEYVVAHPELAIVAELRTITSDMTLAVRHADAPLAGILDRYLQQRGAHIAELARQARSLFNRKALQLTDAELAWLERSGIAVVGAAEDYLPFDYQSQGQYKGIAGEVLQEVAQAVGMQLRVVSAPFARIMEEARAGRIHVVNMAKTEERQADFLFPRPFSPERDIIIGRRSSPPIPDIYALEDQRVAVIDGFWHEEYLRRNLRQPSMVKTADILESLRKVRDGEADYLIENPTVADYYINGLGYQELVKRGDTSGDSSLYFGVSRQQPELAGILDKVLPMLPYEQIKYRALQSVPAVPNESNRRLLWLAGVLAAALVGIVALTAVIARKLTQARLQNQFLREREQWLYTDALTGCLNRNHFNAHVDALEQWLVPPAAVIVADLNNLKRTNDAHGHAAGDALLCAFADAMRAHWPQARLYRMGGDEFLMLLAPADAAALQQQVDLFQAHCAQSAVVLPGGTTLHPSAAIGIDLRDAGSSLDQCIARADQQMYVAKRRQKKRSTDTP
ncbi:transporter substrate-binding domain-containing protein [Curvibacter sp. APW13]|uniref:transporter substrate-binding domain-containing protein n=1 Tax=Curvibacter sp. APW13 TaxID=3077236 RepID=UPI0028DD64B3|nr:transporter substrate-binding domain-containing protein [Curvibacter sp. APW13]MDT8990322.1 transporter substrate-binding domain-containing protein [Curvibacter sp. APW13]